MAMETAFSSSASNSLRGEMPLMYDEIVQENLRLVHQNMLMRAMHENARLACENMMLRRQAVRPPPGLESEASLASSKFLTAQSYSDYALEPTSWSNIQGMGSLKMSILPALSQEESTASGSSLRSTSAHSAQSSSHASDGQQVLSAEKVPTRRDLSSDSATSVMMRNLPNGLTQKMLVELLCLEGFAGCFDFLYVPVDFRSSSGLGYAFVNLVSHEVALRFVEHFTGFTRWRVASSKICKVTWSDAVQGLQAHIERYRNSPVMHESVPEDHKPMLFVGVQQVQFPPPTKTVRAPRRWNRRHQ